MLKVMLHFDGGSTMWFDMDEEEAGRALDAWYGGYRRTFPGYEDGEMFYVDMRAVRMIHVTGDGDGE